MKTFELYGIGNALVDCHAALDDAAFSRLDFRKGCATLIDPHEADRLAADLPIESVVGGGSIANSVILMAQLGGSVGFSGRTGSDRNGRLFRSDLESQGVACGGTMTARGRTGVAIVLVTPDTERTVCVSLGVSRDFSVEDVRASRVGESTWLFVEGHLFGNGSAGREAISEAIRLARAAGTKVAVSASDHGLVQRYRTEFVELARSADLLIANESEGAALSGGRDEHESFARLKELSPAVVLTLGKRGSLIRFGASECRVAATPCTPIDTTGAGDAFAGAFLYGIANGYTVAESAREAAKLAARATERYGARLSDPRWSS